MQIDWSPLRHELAIWRQEKRRLPIWWRDDDAVSATPALAELSDLSRHLGLPVHLAVIPAVADQTLADAIMQAPHMVPTVHGWAHENRAPQGQKKAEFGALHADTADLLARGLERLDALFGTRLSPTFVAPWNRLHADVLPHLATAGYRAVSTFTPRCVVEPSPGLVQINTHIDPIDWRGSRGLVMPDRIIAQTVDALTKRRQGVTDTTEPFGYLTHHLVHDTDIWSFSRAFLAELLEGGAISTPLPTSARSPHEPS
ncbi:polysaccharide deacetylase [Roseobacter cerasinus]|uniref:Polysaccharide deacetylase n=1 Tax=Roseobacter cerasinus TaxID=2602289 RepID=A0A640VX11_9RHOB|nr:polysaccharide deacetylase family protein [Roseobacter cerasinus]GFE50766.1 polysaccharide deacetylase [Roseobacter cerasinus]